MDINKKNSRWSFLETQNTYQVLLLEMLDRPYFTLSQFPSITCERNLEAAGCSSVQPDSIASNSAVRLRRINKESSALHRFLMNRVVSATKTFSPIYNYIIILCTTWTAITTFLILKTLSPMLLCDMYHYYTFVYTQVTVALPPKLGKL